MSFKVAPRETLVKCTAYDNKFRAYPEEVKLKAARIEKARVDSQETEAMRYERLMTQKFLAGHYVIESPRLALLAKVGKAVLIVALFPPFFIFVTFPRFTFQTLVPAIYNKVEEPIVKIVKNVAWISAWSIDIFNIALGKVARKLKITLPRIELPTIKFTFPQKIAKAITKPFQTAAKVIEKTKEAFIALKDKFVSLLKPIQNAFNIVVDKTENFFLKVEEKMTVFANFFKAAPPPMRAYGQKDPVPLWKEKLILAKETIEKGLETAKNIVMAPVHALITQLEPVYNFVTYYLPIVYNNIQTRYESIVNAIKSRIEAASEVVNSIYKKVETALVTMTSTVVESINTFLTPYYPIPGRIVRFIANGGKNVKSFFKQKLAAVLSFGNALKEHAKAFHQLVKKGIKKIPVLVDQFIKGSVRFGINFLKALKSLAIILGVTLKVLYMYMRDLNNRVFKTS